MIVKKAFIVYASTLFLALAYANFNGWNVNDSFKSGKWGPKGHSVYHK
jgi:hypothetical protein